MLCRGHGYEETYDSFRWNIPEHYNIAHDICDKWAPSRDRLALVYEDANGEVREFTFQEMKRFSDRFSNALRTHGIGRGDRIGILLGQCPETAISHLAAYKLGAIAIPLFTLFGIDALEYRLADSAASAVITDESNLPKIMLIRESLPSLRLIVVISGETGDVAQDFWTLVDRASESFELVNTSSDDPALIIYTSGTTGPPKGALHAHRVVLGHVPGVEFPHNFFPQQGDLFWTPADWAWIGGLIDVLFPSWHHGVPVVAHRARKFDPEHAFHFIAKHGIRNAFMPPTALKLMRQVKDPWGGNPFRMRSIGSGGETLGEELLTWGREVMGIDINEFYGQTEVNLTLGNCSEVMDIVPGSMGRPIPGHRVEVLDDSGNPVPAGTSGEIAVKRPDPVMFLKYWNNDTATRDKFVGDWCLTGDLARKDERGYFWFVGRKDDIITSAGYRIGPAEIEDCLLRHPAVGMAAAVGSPDEVRTEIVKAFIVLKQGIVPDAALEEHIKHFVRTRLAAHEFPREIEFVEELPLTTTGKIIRKELKRREIERKCKLR